MPEWDVATKHMPTFQKLDMLLLFALIAPEQRELIKACYLPIRQALFGEIAPTAPPQPVQVNDPNKGAIPHGSGPVHVDYYVKLAGNNEKAREFLVKWGAWWRVSGGYNRNTQWLLESIAEQKRTMPKRTYETLAIGKEADWNYCITNFKTFPTETKRPIKE